MEDWTEKYRPKTLRDVVGNERAISTLRAWAEQWNQGRIPKSRAAILSGKPGTGKTSSALALAHDLGWTVLELNASDARNETSIKRVATAGAINETFDNAGEFTPSRKGGRKLIILDEADNLYEKLDRSEAEGNLGDKGGKKAIIDTIRITKQPIILIVNDYYDLTKGGGEALKSLCTVIQFYDVNPNHIVELLKRICRQEDIVADIQVLKTITDRSKGDVRSAVNDLQSLGSNRKQISIEDVDVLGYRDRETLIFDALREVFKTKSLQNGRDCMRNTDVQPEMLLLWITENLPREYLDIEDLVRGYDAVSKADLFFGRVKRGRAYELWSYACDLMSGGVSVAKTHSYGNTHYMFPLWMKEMKGNQSARMLRDGVVKKISMLNHTSDQKTKEMILPHFQAMFRNNTRFACRMIKMLDFSESEVKFLLGEKHLHKMKDVVQCAEKTDEKQGEIEITAVVKKKVEEEKKESSDLKQPSIFDF
ncbi:MAG TPA: replication factor C large subunit [Thermoplasmata archaeon]|jgi:replication factor C large subunit|nr:MAG TPA: replication factor C large subunit [Thermoplasmata archaeon]